MGHTRFSSPIATIALALLTAGLIAACGADKPDTGTSPTPGAAVNPTTSPTPTEPPPQALPSFVPPPGGVVPPSAPPGGGEKPPPGGGGDPPAKGETVMTGQVTAGVEAGCLLLNNGGKAYLLLGGDRNVIQAGATVTVRGRVAEGVMSICQQGTPFQVVEARPATS